MSTKINSSEDNNENNTREELYMDIFKRVSNSKKWFHRSLMIGTISFIISITLLIYVLFFSKIIISWDNIVYILWGFFFSWIIFIIIPTYLQWENEKGINEKIINDIREFRNNEERFIDIINENDWKVTKDEIFIKFRERYWKNCDYTVYSNLKTEKSKYIWTIREKNNLWPIIKEDKEWKVSLTDEGKKFFNSTLIQKEEA